MHFLADLHIHSRYSMATSREMTPESIYRWAKLKGLKVIGTGDFTHPAWLAELEEKLEPAEDGFYRLKGEYASPQDERLPQSCQGPARFVFSAEVSTIYKKGERVRKIHHLILVSSIERAREISTRLERIGNTQADGRPTLGLNSRDLLELVLSADEEALLIPAHAWTPHFSVFGSASGFDSLEECYEDLASYIPAIETGLSSDPAMNWRLSCLDKLALISNSDAHSPTKLGREANIFSTEFSYWGIKEAIWQREKAGLLGTIEFFPEEGKYHYDGHRACQQRLAPQETKQHQHLCPVCGRPVTVGVMYRVEELADRPPGVKPPGARPYYRLIQLEKVLAEALGVRPGTKQVQAKYFQMLERFGSELEILLHAPLEDIRQVVSPIVAEGIRRVRQGEVYIAPGYDGVHGEISIFRPEERREFTSQLSLF